MAKTYFRAGVGGIIIDRKGRVLAFERSDVAAAWQLPQGGLKDAETPLEAVYREILEETGITRDELALVGEHPEWLAYELPEGAPSKKKFRGQVQRWFLFTFVGDKKDLSLAKARDREFSAMRWMRFEALMEKTVFFRKGVYRRLFEEFGGNLK